MQVDDLPAHTHTGTTGGAGDHTHDGSAVSYSGSNTMNASVNPGSTEPDLYAPAVALSINSAGSHTHNFTTAHTHGVTVNSTGAISRTFKPPTKIPKTYL